MITGKPISCYFLYLQEKVKAFYFRCVLNIVELLDDNSLDIFTYVKKILLTKRFITKISHKKNNLSENLKMLIYIIY